MYKTSTLTIENLEYLDIDNSNGESKLRLCLNQGARIDQLKIDNIQVISETNPKSYKDNYASAILFPFANRIKDGRYTFNDINYSLDCNESDKNNAIHGLVYDKTFEYVSSNLASDFGSVTLKYEDNGTSKGFPFAYEIFLMYLLNASGIKLAVKILNKDKKAFPFTLGWHPYFDSLDLSESTINFESKTKFLFDEQQIVTGKTAFKESMPYSLKDVKLDDAYILEADGVEFTTPEYVMSIKSSSKDNFLQLYTPNEPKRIAIEPMTGACDSFNNKIGLQVLHSNNQFEIAWEILIISSISKNIN